MTSLANFYTVLEQCSPIEFHPKGLHKGATGDFYANLVPLGEVMARSSSEALDLAKKVFKIRFPILKKLG